jgi:1,4-alpha-glucan branching enzyme
MNFSRLTSQIMPKYRWFKFLFLLIAAGFSSIVTAQIYQPDGLRMPGAWNSWTNSTAMGGDFDLQKSTEGTERWTTSFQYTGVTGSNAFKFVSTSFSDPWGNQWAGNTAVALNAVSNFIYGTPSDPDNTITMTSSKWYNVVFEDIGYVNTRAVFSETSSQAVTISNVMQTPVLVANLEPVTVSAGLSALPTTEEKFYLRYSVDDWLTSALIPMQTNAAAISAIIPGQVSSTVVEYYIFSSVFSNPDADIDLKTLRKNNNGGSNFSYTVDLVIECNAQVGLIGSEPAFPIDNTPVTIYFNAAFGNGGLFDYTGDVYAHTGVITNLSINSTDWKYVKTEWGENTPATKLTCIDDNTYSLTISNIRTFYGVPAAEQIKKLAFVFRSATEQTGGYYLEHKNADGSDILADVYPLALNVKILSPSRKEPLVSPNAVLPVCVEALQNNLMKLYLDNELLTESNTTSITYPLVAQTLSPGEHWIKAVATGTTGQVRDSVQIYLRGPVVVEELPEGMKNGINYINNNTVTLVLNDAAALKNFAFAIGEFSNWLPNDANYMKRTPDGKHYWVTLNGLQSGKEYAYQYFIDGNLKVADAYSEKILDPWNDRWIATTTYPSLKAYPFDKTIGIVSVFQTNKAVYQWEVPDFTPAAVNATQSDLFIYELLVRDFVESRSLNEVKTKLDYLEDLGVNAVQLMPVIEFDGNESWGYAPNFFFAPDKYYGTPQAYKQFIDECHKRGIAVILDIVPNHAFGQCPMVQMYFDPNAGENGQPSASNPWFNTTATHPFSVGYDFNHESPATRQFFKDVFAHWINEYNIDGFRIDLSKGLTQKNTGDDINAWSSYDQSRINILTDYYNFIKSVNQDTYVILEHLGQNDEETVLANTGMLLWSAMQGKYKQVALGYQENSDVSWAYHANRGWNYPNLVDYMDNHDEERLMFESLTYGNSSGSYNIKDTLTAIKRMELAAVQFMGIPGPKMMFEFTETAYDYSIFFNGDRVAAKPVRWDYLDQPAREHMNRIVGAMAKLRKSDAFRFGSFTKDLGGLGKRMWITHSSMDVVIALNMGVTGFDMAPGFTKSGTWYDYFTGEAINVTNASGHTVYFEPGAYRVFTSVALPKPFHELTIKVLDDESGLPMEGAQVNLSGAGNRLTDGTGTALFLSLPQPVTVTATKFGWIKKSVTATVSGAAEITIRMIKDESAVGEEKEGDELRVYPNPAKDVLTVETKESGLLYLFSTDGKKLMQQEMGSPTELLDITGIKKGIYILRFNGKKGSYYRKVVVQ